MLDAALFDAVRITVFQNPATAVFPVEAHRHGIFEVYRIARNESHDAFGVGVELARLPLCDRKTVRPLGNLVHFHIRNPLLCRRPVNDDIVTLLECSGLGTAHPELPGRDVVVLDVVSRRVVFHAARTRAADDDQIALHRACGYEHRAVGFRIALPAQDDSAFADADCPGNVVDTFFKYDCAGAGFVDRRLDQGRGICTAGRWRQGCDDGDCRNFGIAPAIAHAAEVGDHVAGRLPCRQAVGFHDRIASVRRGGRRRCGIVARLVDGAAQQSEYGRKQN